jgi:hypothetical protein
MRALRLMPILLLIACGDNEGKQPRPDARPNDAAVDSPPMLTCGYNEMADATNDELFTQTSVPEASGLSFAQAFQLCGKLDSSHYDAQSQRVDSDSYQFTVPAASSAIVYFVAPGADNFDNVIVEISTTQGGLSATGEFVGNFAVTAREDLPPGDYMITVTAYDAAAPTAALDYKINVLIDSPTRCTKASAAANYTEAADGLTADGNDVIEVRYGGQPRRKLTDSALDMPEPTGITVAAGGTYRITGENTMPAVSPASWADSFQDRDTYLVTMGADANTLSVRLNWPGTTADFDFFVFPADSPIELANGWDGGNMEDEFVTTAVAPNTSYLIWAGVDDASTGQPINYDLTVCGGTYATTAPAPSPAHTDATRRYRVLHETQKLRSTAPAH